MVVADTIIEAKSKAKSGLNDDIKMLHTDHIIDIDDILRPSEIIDDAFVIKLTPSQNAIPMQYTHGYFLVP